MTSRRGIVAAAAFAVVVTGAYAAWSARPLMRGTEVVLPAALLQQPGVEDFVTVSLPIAKIQLDVVHTAPPADEPFEPVRRAGDWWIAGGTDAVNARRLRGRPLYLQLVPDQARPAGGSAVMRASTVSDRPVEGSMNLAATVTSVREDGYVWLDFGFAPIPVPRELTARARPFVPSGARHTATSSTLPAADPGVGAVLRVLPSGRAVLAGVTVNGTRY